MLDMSKVVLTKKKDFVQGLELREARLVLTSTMALNPQAADRMKVDERQALEALAQHELLREIWAMAYQDLHQPIVQLLILAECNCPPESLETLADLEKLIMGLLGDRYE